MIPNIKSAATKEITQPAQVASNFDLSQSLKVALSAEGFAKLEESFALLERQVAGGLFTAWSVACPAFDMSACFAEEWKTPSPAPLFDLGSLTKPLFAGSLFCLLHSDWSEKLFESISPLFNQFDLGPLTYLDLFSHQSGAQAWKWFGKGLTNKNGKRLGTIVPRSAHLSDCSSTGLGYLNFDQGRIDSFKSRLLEDIISSITQARAAPTLSTSPFSPSGVSQVIYSDCGYYLLSLALEKCLRTSGMGWRGALGDLNKKLGTSFHHASLSPAAARHAVPYFPYFCAENDEARPENTWNAFGPVHDTNANILACLSPENPQVSAHAGLFGSVQDVKQALLYLAENLRKLRVKEPSSLNPLRNDRFCFCLDTPQSEATLSAAEPSEFLSTFGHLGFTGTSAWFQLDSSQNGLGQAPPKFWILLTNRTATHRTVFGASENTRLYQFKVGPEVFYASASDNQINPVHPFSLKNLTRHSADDWEEIRERMHSSRSILWDSSKCSAPCPIAETRRQVGRLLWS